MPRLARRRAAEAWHEEVEVGEVPVAIVGSGNIGTDLMLKLLRREGPLRPVAMVGIDPASDGLARAAAKGLETVADGVAGLLERDVAADVRVVFDATSARAHVANAELLADHPAQLVDLTPAAIGPYTVPVVNGDANADERNVNMVTCGGQATVPIVAAIAGVAPVPYAEIVASIASRSAGPGTRANIDEFTETTAHAIEVVGGAGRGKAIIVLNPAEPPLVMRDTVVCLAGDADADAFAGAVEAMVAEVQRYVPGYRLKQRVVVEPVDPERDRIPEGVDPEQVRNRVDVFLEVEGAADYLPAWAGNLDIMTAAAVAAAEGLATVREATR
ncbi:acetaldehyde dehydrogenase (acetylating) [Nitriliruptoraceae bacterium ZYF776]|nr:acetaldehyde dehydrogenase (acetylating) [Profundirhabdus halotolerans]